MIALVIVLAAAAAAMVIAGPRWGIGVLALGLGCGNVWIFGSYDAAPVVSIVLGGIGGCLIALAILEERRS